MVQVRLAVKVSKLEICYVLLQRHIATMSTCGNACLWVSLSKESTGGRAGYHYSSGPVPSVHCGFPTGNGKFGCYTTQALDLHRNISLLTWRVGVGENLHDPNLGERPLIPFYKIMVTETYLLPIWSGKQISWLCTPHQGLGLPRACLLALCFGRSEFAKQNCCWLHRCHTTLPI